MDLSELIDAGYTADDVVIRCDRDQATMYSDVSPAEISSPILYKDNIYYIEITYPDGRAALPISEGRHQYELMLALVFPDYGSGWDASNDYSNTELLDTEDAVITEYIPVYIDGVLYYGTEPDGTTADGGMTPTEASTNAVTEATDSTTDSETDSTTDSSDILWGDANVDGAVDISDAVSILNYVSNASKYPMTEQGLANADVNQNGDGISNSDTLAVQRYISNVISALPETYQ
ncbi:MAG: dockerin type I repeat-containing protein [Ruminococcus sp.]|nr:dockerin type I repeat-containing protein [Ruminococcus sp.]